MCETDYSISWQYIVLAMEERFGIAPGSSKKISMGKIERCIETIWNEYVDKIDEQHAIRKVENKNGTMLLF